MIHMKYQDLFSLKKKKKSAAVVVSALTVIICISNFYSNDLSLRELKHFSR